jgi:uncharacterized protein (TIGR02996 family)
MSQGNELLRAILMNPKCDTTRLVYADWLEENGDPERAEFIRVQIHLSKNLDPEEDPSPELCLLLGRQRELAAKNAIKWFPIQAISRCKKPIHHDHYRLYEDEDGCWELYFGIRFYRYRDAFSFRHKVMIERGFVRSVIIRLKEFKDSAKLLFENHPIQRASVLRPVDGEYAIDRHEMWLVMIMSAKEAKGRTDSVIESLDTMVRCLTSHYIGRIMRQVEAVTGFGESEVKVNSPRNMIHDGSHIEEEAFCAAIKELEEQRGFRVKIESHQWDQHATVYVISW